MTLLKPIGQKPIDPKDTLELLKKIERALFFAEPAGTRPTFTRWPQEVEFHYAPLSSLDAMAANQGASRLPGESDVDFRSVIE